MPPQVMGAAAAAVAVVAVEAPLARVVAHWAQDAAVTVRKLVDDCGAMAIAYPGITRARKEEPGGL